MKGARRLGWYRPAVRIGNLVFSSGQLPVDETGNMLQAGPREEARLALNNLRDALRSAGAELSDVAKVTIFLKDLRTFTEVDGVYREFFPENPPARSTVGVSGLPKDAPLEIEAIAVVGEAGKADRA